MVSRSSQTTSGSFRYFEYLAYLSRPNLSFISEKNSPEAMTSLGAPPWALSYSSPPLASEGSEGKATPESRCGRRTRPLSRCLGLLVELPLGGLTVLRARLNTCPAHRDNRASCLLASRSHRTELATAVQRSQSPKLRVTVPKAGCINGA